MLTIPTIIPPKTRVVLEGRAGLPSEHKKDVGREFRIGYYGRKDGLNCIWLVNERGEYEQTVDRDYLLKFFRIVRLTTDDNYFGDDRSPLRALKSRTPRHEHKTLKHNLRHQPSIAQRKAS